LTPQPKEARTAASEFIQQAEEAVHPILTARRRVLFANCRSRVESLFALLIRDVLNDLLHGRQVCNLQRLVCRSLDVGLDSRSLPVRLACRMDRAAGWYEGAKMIAQAPPAARVRASAGRFADDRRPLQVLQVVGKLLRRGKSPV
jgi:hypothetical protein